MDSPGFGGARGSAESGGVVPVMQFLLVWGIGLIQGPVAKAPWLDLFKDVYPYTPDVFATGRKSEPKVSG